MWRGKRKAVTCFSTCSRGPAAVASFFPGELCPEQLKSAQSATSWFWQVTRHDKGIAKAVATLEIDALPIFTWYEERSQMCIDRSCSQSAVLSMDSSIFLVALRSAAFHGDCHWEDIHPIESEKQNTLVNPSFRTGTPPKTIEALWTTVSTELTVWTALHALLHPPIVHSLYTLFQPWPVTCE